MAALLAGSAGVMAELLAWHMVLAGALRPHRLPTSTPATLPTLLTARNPNLGRRPAAQVIVVEDENGNIVRETMKDNDLLAQYRSMRETLIYLSHLDHEDTENQMLEKLRQQMVAQLQVRARAWPGLPGAAGAAA